MKPCTVEELRNWAKANGMYDDIFMRADLFGPPGSRVERDPAQLQRWLDQAWGVVTCKKRDRDA